MRKPASVFVLMMGFCLVLCRPAAAEEATTQAAALAKTVQNPIANLITLPFQFNYNLGVGAYKRTSLNLNVQPVIPFPGKKWNVIARTIIPINSLPQGQTQSAFGIGDATLSLYVSPAQAGKVVWGLGPIFGLPTASNPELLGSGKLGIGPSGVILVQPGKWTIGAVAGNVWSVVGDSDRDHYSLLTFQYFINYNFGHGWALGSVPIITANWKASSGNQWTIPWGLQISKVTRFGSQPVNLLVGYYYNSEHPDGAADAQVRFQLNLMYPTKK